MKKIILRRITTSFKGRNMAINSRKAGHMREPLCDSTAMSDPLGDRRRVELRIYIARMYYRIQHSCAEKRPYFKTGMWTSISEPTGRYLE